MDFNATVFHDDAPPGLSAAELAKLADGVVEGISKAEAAQASIDAPQVAANWTLSNTVKLRTSLAAAISGTGYSTHVVLGDSLSSMFNGVTFDFANSWWRKLWRALIASGVPTAGTGRVAMSDFTGAPVDVAETSDSRISQTGGWSHYDVAYGSPAGGGTVTFASDTPGTIVDVYYLSSGGPAFTVSIDGTPHTVTPTGDWHRAVDTTTGLSDTAHTVTVTAAADTADGVLLFGFRVRRTAGIAFDNFAIKYGIAANNQENDAGDLTGSALAQDYSSDADVLWIALGANDLGEERTPAQIVADITGLRARWPDADCVLIIEPENVDYGTDYDNYVTAMRSLAVTLNVPLLDLSLRFGTNTQLVAAGLGAPDDVHITTVAQSDWASVALDAVHSVGPRVLA